MFSIKKYIGVLIILLLIILSIGCTTDQKTTEKLKPQPTGESPSEELTKIRLGWFKGGTIVAQYVAQDMGYFEEEGLELEIIDFTSTADAIPATVSGDLEFGIASSPAILNAIEAGIPIKALGLAAYSSAEEGQTDLSYVVLEASDIQGVEDLKGKKIAIPYEGSTSHIYIVALLTKHGIDPSEVELVMVPWPHQIDALVRGDIDVAGLFATHLAKMELEGIDYKVVASSLDLLGRVEGVLIYSSTDYIEKNPDTVRRFLKAFYRGQNYLETNPEANSMYLANYLGWEPTILEKMTHHGLPHGGRFNRPFWEGFMEMMVDNGFLEEEIPLEKIYTEKYLPELEEL